MLARTHGELRLSKEAPSGGEAPDADAGALPFRFLLGDLAEHAGNRLQTSSATVCLLAALGEAMTKEASDRAPNSAIPAAFTYFGQFMDHDMTSNASAFVGTQDPIALSDLRPLSRREAEALQSNARKAPLELECLYDAPPQAYEPNGLMKLGTVSAADARLGPIPTSDRFHDVPRRPWVADPQTEEQHARDREALIGDLRNDENLIISQMHVAFLRTHNRLALAHGAAAAKQLLRHRFQWAVLHDYLDRICDPCVVKDVRARGPQFVKMGTAGGRFMPLEFSGAAYRFGHSMIRSSYDYNASVRPGFLSGSLKFMFTFTALSGNMGPPTAAFETLPDNWIIEWPRFFGHPGAGKNPARRIDTKLAEPLNQLTNTQGKPTGPPMGRLATRNLLRGYWLGLPTGQAVAKFLNVRALSEEALLAAAPVAVRKMFAEQDFHKATPLWFYILAEAGDPAGADGQHLGTVGSRIVAETLWSFVKHARDSVLSQPPGPEEIARGEFTLRDIIAIGQDPGMKPLPRVPPVESATCPL